MSICHLQYKNNFIWRSNAAITVIIDNIPSPPLMPPPSQVGRRWDIASRRFELDNYLIPLYSGIFYYSNMQKYSSNFPYKANHAAPS